LDATIAMVIIANYVINTWGGKIMYKDIESALKEKNYTINPVQHNQFCTGIEFVFTNEAKMVHESCCSIMNNKQQITKSSVIRSNKTIVVMPISLKSFVDAVKLIKPLQKKGKQQSFDDEHQEKTPLIKSEDMEGPKKSTYCCGLIRI
jgi:hypothetical protein